MIFSYNKEAVGDVLLTIVANSEGKEVAVERKADVARIFTVETNDTVGLNFFNISKHVSFTNSGQVFLTQEQITLLNQLIKEGGFSDTLVFDERPKFVVGLVKECVKHADSDHLSVTQIEVDEGEILQIVCGAPNIQKGQKVVVAKPGAMMPNGLVIWPGNLRGEASFGMVCSAKELNLANASLEKGILVLPEATEVGSAFVGE